MIGNLIDAYNQFSDKERIGIIGSNPTDSVTGIMTYGSQCKQQRWIEERAVVTSASLMPLAPYRHVGPFRNELFIDGVDQEYCFRLRREGYHVIVACDAKFLHSLGYPIARRFIWRRVIPTNHSALRRYYMTRNRLVIAKEYIHSEFRWVALQLLALFKAIVLIVLFESDKAAKLRMVMLGIYDGMTGRMGPHGEDGSVIR